MHRKKLGDLGEQLVLDALVASGFSSVRDLNAVRLNHPGGDIYAERDGKPFFITVKARKKFQQDGRLNGSYNIYPEKVIRAAREYGATPAWVMVQVDTKRRRYSAYFGTIGQLANPAGVAVPMTPNSVEAYECLVAERVSKRIQRSTGDAANGPQHAPTSDKNSAVVGMREAGKSADELLQAEALGFSKDTKTHLAVAMYLRPEGATTAEVTAVNGGPYLNCLKQVVALGHKVLRRKVQNSQGRWVLSYKIAIRGSGDCDQSSPELVSKRSAGSLKNRRTNNHHHLSHEERQRLRRFIEWAVREDRSQSLNSRMQGLASGSIRNLLRIRHPSLAKSVGSRSALVDAARDLGFVIRAYPGGGGLKGTVTWETIDLS